MSKLSGAARLFLLTSALGTPALASAQTGPGSPATPTAPSAATGAQVSNPLPNEPTQDTPEAQTGAPEVSVPGGDIVVTGRRSSNIERNATEVVNLLSSADIARTGEGDIAGALSRVTGLSVVGNGFVYVRGLGDRYSLALLNGSPLPSPEPLRRVVPLDIFPTNVIASSLVQKSYSVNFPGEFGGGVINLTTTAAPAESFLTVSAGISGDSETTARLGYTYFGSDTDWTGFSGGNNRNLPPALADFFASKQRISSGAVDTQAIASQIVNGRNSVLQRNTQIPPNWSAASAAGTTIDIGSTRLGLILSGGYSNKWLTRSTLQQTPATQDLSEKATSYQRVITDDRVVLNGLFGVGLEFGPNRIRWTNLFIRDTLKQARLGSGFNSQSNFDFLQQDTAWYERQLVDTQVVGEFHLGPLEIDMRGGYANTHRKAPYELSDTYARTNLPNDPFGTYYVNRLDNQRGTATATFSNLNEDLISAGADLSYRLTDGLTASAGYAYQHTTRYSARRDFQFFAPSDFPTGIGLLRPDALLGPAIIQAFNVRLIETTETDPAFDAALKVHAGYAKVVADFGSGLSLDAGVRYENGDQSVTPTQVFLTPSNSGASNRIKRDYWLPAATLTYQVAPDMQVRANASKTIARPQFRELIFQQYYDPETNRQFRGNPLLTDTQLYNAELRYEWYFAREQHLSIAGFYKRLDNPIEAFTGFSDNVAQTSFANAPRANLYGGEVEVQKYIPLDSLGGPLFDQRRLVAIANYTYTQSKLKVRDGDTVAVFGTTVQPAGNFFRDGSPLTGQSDHLVNLQLGMESTDHLSQQTILFEYASRRVTSRGAVGLPDIYEVPGLHLDFVAREGVTIGGVDATLKLDIRNITGTKYQEFQEVGDQRNYYNLYKVGTSFSLGLGVTF